MKLAASLLALSASSTLVAAHLEKSYPKNARHHEYINRRDRVLAGDKRQEPAPATHSSSAAAAATGTTSGSAPAAAVTTPTLPATYIPPLEQLTASGAIESTMTMFTTYTAGATAPISGAPALPTIAINPANYPALDQTPPLDTTQVKQWLAEIDLSQVPQLTTTVDGSCASDPAAAADTSRCWWTCGGCLRDTDVSVCPDKLTWGLTYDDGPSPYTPKLLNYLHEKDLLATFYVVGSRVISRPEMVQTEYMTGHEISIHTWSHTPLTTLTNEEIVAELGWTRKAIFDVIGVSPKTFRPPYGDIDDRVRAVAAAMGLTPVIWTRNGNTEFDTKDWRIAGGTANGTSSFEAWKTIVATVPSLDTGFLTLQHDLYQESVDMAVGYIVPDALTHSPAFNMTNVINCLNEPAGNAYNETSKTTSAVGGNSTSSNGNSSNGSGQTTQSGGNGNGAAFLSANGLVAVFVSVVAGVVSSLL